MTVTRKKLIEVALPLEAINAASEAEKQPGIGAHPRGLHLWWARRPLATARAVIFSQMVDDPSAVPEEFPTKEKQDAERQRLFDLIKRLVLWENSTNETVLQMARDEIWRSWRRACEDNKDDPRAPELYNPEKLPAFHDPFAGGGSLPLEAQRLGLEAYASDLNPVAVLINKAMIEIPPKFAGRPPVNPESRAGRGSTTAAWKGAAGLAEDVRYYGKWIRDEAEKRIGHLYPKVLVTPEMVRERPDLTPYEGRELTVIAWIWARTVKSPNPAYAHVDVPLASTFMLSTKDNKEAYVEPVLEGNSYRFTVKAGKPTDADAAKNGTKLSRGANFRCIVSGEPIAPAYIYAEAQAGRMSSRLMAIVAEGDRGRVYLAPALEAEEAALKADPAWKPDLEMPKNPRWFSPPLYGLTTFGDLFTPRQLVALTTFSDLVGEAREQARQDAIAAGLPEDARGLEDGGTGAQAYADALSLYLAFAADRMADYNSSIATWKPSGQQVMQTFKRQALPMTWDFPESNYFAESAICWSNAVKYTADNVLKTASTSAVSGSAFQADAQNQIVSLNKIVSTDPPYYDNIGYADLSDFFYVWLRRALRPVLPDLFKTLAVPKAEELVATAYRHGTKEKAEQFFLSGMTQAAGHLATQAHPFAPVTIYYAFKQSEDREVVTASDTPLFEGRVAAEPIKVTTSTGWETFLEAVIRAGFQLTGTWPMRTELSNRIIGSGTNALASSVVLACRPRPVSASAATRSDFLQELAITMRAALPVMTAGQIAPVDLAQASIGPGMAVYSKYSQILRQDGKPVTVREALQDINNAISAYRTERTSSFDQRTRFCIDFYDQFGFSEADFDDATILARAQAVGVNTLQDEGLLVAGRGRASLVPPFGYPEGVEGLADRDFGDSAWEACMRLAATLLGKGGEADTAALARQLGEGICARARELAVWLYTIADARKRTQDALAFNALDASWPEIQRLIAGMDTTAQQGRMI